MFKDGKNQKDFLWGGGTLESKPHLVKWITVCSDQRKGAKELGTFIHLTRHSL